MNFLVISHASVLQVNREVFDRLVRDRGDRVTIVTPRKWKADMPPSAILDCEEGVPGGARVLPLRVFGSGSGSLHVYLARLRSLMRRERPDVLFIDEEAWTLAADQWLHAGRDVPIRVLYVKDNLGKRLPFPFGQLRRRHYNLLTHLCVISEECATAARRTGYGGPLILLPHGIETERFRSAAESRRRTSERPVFGYFGRFVEYKNVPRMVEAFGRAIRAGMDADLLLMGAGPEEGRVRMATEKAGITDRIRWMPPARHSDMPRYYALLDVLLLFSKTTPSIREQFGRVLIEALATGVPFIGSRSGGIAEIWKSTGGGILVEEDDVEGLARAMVRLAAQPDERKELGRKGQVATEATYSASAVAKKLADALDHTLAYLRDP